MTAGHPTANPICIPLSPYDHPADFTPFGDHHVGRNVSGENLRPRAVGSRAI